MPPSAEVRARLVSTLRRDLIGRGPEDLDLAEEELPDRPSRWYLTGYLVPTGAPRAQREALAGPEDELDAGSAAGDSGGSPPALASEVPT